MAKSVQIRKIELATLMGDQWQPVLSESTGEVIGIQAAGTNCKVFIDSPGDLHEVFTIPDQEKVLLKDGLAVIPDAKEHN
jgi:hypothetical protein